MTIKCVICQKELTSKIIGDPKASLQELSNRLFSHLTRHHALSTLVSDVQKATMDFFATATLLATFNQLAIVDDTPENEELNKILDETGEKLVDLVSTYVDIDIEEDNPVEGTETLETLPSASELDQDEAVVLAKDTIN